MRILDCLTQQHDLFLTLLAALVGTAGSLVTARLYRKVLISRRDAHLAWLFMAAVSGGATIWCTHFVAMMAYRPGVAATYEPMMTGLSLLVAVVGSALAMWTASRRHRLAPAVGGVMFGLTVAGMHYVGMSAFTAEALLIWHPVYVAASLIAAVLGGAAAFHLGAGEDDKRAPLLAAVGLVITIVALHFTGMGALTVLPLAAADGALNADAAQALLAMGVAAVGFLILGTAVASHALEEQTQQLSRVRLHQLIEGSVDGMLVEGDGKVLVANAAMGVLCGMDATDMAGEAVARFIAEAEALDGGVLVESQVRPVKGASVPVEILVRRARREDGDGHYRIFAVRDLRARQEQERRITRLATTDSLTGLPNRAAFLEALDAQIEQAGETQGFALFSIDLTRFKEVNDVHGHAVGDDLLVHVARRMFDTRDAGDFVARLGGDEFIGLTPVSSRLEAMEAAERLRAAIMTPLDLGHAEIACGAAIGIAMWPEDARAASALINNADLAMYRAKASLAQDVCFYEEAMDDAVRRRRRMAQELREALDDDQFELHYQMQASLRTGRLTGFEVLLRWRREDGVQVSPAEFIPLAEETGLILPIGEWVLRHACAEAATWAEPHKIAVNLSPVQLSHVDLPRLVHQILVETGLSPSRLELEITETAMIADMVRTTHVLRQLKALGVTIAMDDFGTGYSSLSTLRAFPFDKIKLDRSFMPELEGDEQARAIIRAVLALGESLDIPVLAEGVETESQLDFLRGQGCDEAQGYLLGRPTADAHRGRTLVEEVLPGRAAA